MKSKALIKNMIRFNARVSNDKQLKMPITESVDAVVSNRVPIDRAGLYISGKITEALDLN